MRQINHISFAILLLVSSGGAFAFQLQKSAPIQLPSKRASTIATPPKKTNPVKSRTLVASHVRFPRKAKPAKQAKIRKYTFGAKSRSIVLAHQTTTSANGGTINFTLDIGAPSVKRSSVLVKNAPAGMTFSRASWQSLSGALPNGFNLISAHGGSEESPILTITFAIPDGAENIIPTVTTLASAPLGGIHFPPSLKIIGKVEQRVYDPKVYSGPLVVSVSQPRRFRSLRTVSLSVPLVNSSGTGALRKFTVGIKYTGGNATQSGNTSDPLFADMNSRIVANPGDVKKFAVPLHSSNSPHTPTAGRNGRFSTQSVLDTSASEWIDPNAAYIRLAVTRDGLYRVNASDLNFSDSSFTLTKSHWTPQNLRCFNHGAEVPVWIDTDAAGNIAGIEFYGQHLRGFPLPTIQNSVEIENQLPEYYNVATDTNVYWLTSSGTGSVRRYFPKSSVSASAQPISSGAILLHHERDLNSYIGDAGFDQTFTLQVTEYIAGKRFEWFEFHSPLEDTFNLHFTDTFFISKLPSNAAGLSANFKFLLRGMTAGGPTAHLFTVTVNGKLIPGEGEFTDYSYDSMTVSVPLSQLVEGPNVLQITAQPSNESIDQFYLDYYEVTVPAALAPSSDTAIAKGQWLFTAPPLTHLYQLPLIFNGIAPHLYNLTDGTRIFPVNGIFTDSTKTDSASYSAATSASLMKCDNIQSWNTNGKDWAILSSSNKADYIVITHPNFLNAAQALILSRHALGMNTMVVTTDQVFNAFDYGSNEPEAIRRFLTYAYNNYGGTPVGFVTLLGEASWDPKLTIVNPVSTKQSFVPTYGNPVSDYYYTISEDSSLSSQPLMMIARIPVSSASAAQSYVNKLSEYENEPPAEWDRHFLFITGGDSASENPEFNYEDSLYLYSTGSDDLSTPPTNIHGSIIERRSFDNGLDATLVGVITDSLQSGQSIMFFTGHGATFTSDVLFPDASLLRNKGLYPLLMTGSCRTGAFAEPTLIGVNESYIQASEAGAIQAYGTTGFGTIDEDDIAAETFFQLMRGDSNTTTSPKTLNTTQMLTVSKLYAALFYGQIGHNSAMQYSILGDAATGFALRPQAEFAVYSNQIQAFAGADTVSKTAFSVSDSILTIRALIHNYGYSSDRPVVVKITDAGPSGFPISQFDTLPGFNELANASAQFAINAQSIGSHTITVFIDPIDSFPETYKPDNISSIHITVSGLSTTPFYPYEGSREFCDVAASNVHFIVLTPTGSLPTDKVELQLDTTQAFSNTLLDQSTTIGSAYYVTFDEKLPGNLIPYSGVYWWRTRIVRSASDMTDWEYATFSTSPAPRPEFSYTSPEQLASTINNGLSLDAQGRLYISTHDTLRYEAVSHGVNDIRAFSNPVSQVFINDKPIYSFTDSLGSAYAVVVFSADGSQIDTLRSAQFQLFYGDTQQTLQAAASVFDSVINSIPAGRKVIVLTVGQPALGYFIASIGGALETLGSAHGMAGLVTWGSYALIGIKGEAPGTAIEGFNISGTNGVDISDMDFTTGNSGGAQTPFTAVAKDYGMLSWAVDSVQAGGSDITFTVLGSRRDGTGVDVVKTINASQGPSINLSGVDPRIYDRLGVSMNFMRPPNSTLSPTLSGIQLQYDAAPELYFSPDTIIVMPNSTVQGNSVVAKYAVSTLTCTPADSVVVQLIRLYRGQTDTATSHLIHVLSGDTTISDTIQTGNELGLVTLNAIVNPNEAINEQLLFNNSITGQYNVTRDTTKPFGDILFVDPGTQIGRHIPDCGFVSSKTGISIQLTSANPIRADTNSISALLVFEGTGASATFAVSKSNPGNFLVDFKSFPPPSQLQAQLNITPTTQSGPFTAGQWNVYAFVQDASGNIDTIVQCFTVSDVNGIQHVMNYPNPFKDKTDFTYVLMSDAPAEVKIIVYTIAGRKIRTLTPLTNHAGLNVVEWDGADERGNQVGNGTYLYRVVINGKNPDGSTVSDGVTERAVRSR